MKDLLMIKWGGSLLTDKRRPGRARREVIERLAQELASARGDTRVVLGHGSGSFGHVAAQARGVCGGPAPEQAPSPLAIAAVQRAAAALHGQVMAALEQAQAGAYSLPPSAFMVACDGRARAVTLEPLERALDLGLVPVVFGDMLTDRSGSAAVCSTEEVLRTLVEGLRQRGQCVRKLLWLGETAGIYDRSGAVIPRVDRHSFSDARAAIGAPAGIDVTGGMMLRLETARVLARAGTESWIVDGTAPGLLTAALCGETVPGTCFAAD
jgi:isopentenyl phosphate kinase